MPIPPHRASKDFWDGMFYSKAIYTPQQATSNIPLVLLYLVNQVDAIVKLLTLEERMKVIEQVAQLFFTVPVWYNDCRFVTSHTVGRAVVPT